MRILATIKLMVSELKVFTRTTMRDRGRSKFFPHSANQNVDIDLDLGRLLALSAHMSEGIFQVHKGRTDF